MEQIEKYMLDEENELMRILKKNLDVKKKEKGYIKG